jgi:hypothetical protein
MISSTSSTLRAGAVGALGAQRLGHVGDRQDAREQVEAEAGAPARVAAAVEALVVVAGDAGDGRERGHAPEDLLGQAGMGAHGVPLLGAELARLVEDQVRDGELAEVVQQAGAAQRAQRLGVEAEARAEGDGDLGDALGVAAGVRRLRVDHARERLGDAVELLLVGDEHPVGRLDGVDPAASSEAQNPASGATSSSASTSAGSNHVPRRRRATASAPSRPPSCQKTSIVWARHRIRPSGEIRSPARPSG